MSGLSGWCPGKSISALYHDVFSFDYIQGDSLCAPDEQSPHN